MDWKPVFKCLQEGRSIDFDFQCVASVLSPQECKSIVQMAPELHAERNQMSWGSDNQNIRDTDLHWLHISDSNAWLFDRVAGAVKNVNSEVFRFDLDGTIGGFQLGRYGIGQGYDWHCDMGARAPRRKLSVSIQLTDPAEYEGGSMEFFRTETETAKAWREIGSLTVFPGYMLHRVTRITRGERWSLVTWLEGTPFR